MTAVLNNGGVSFWWTQAELNPQPELTGAVDADVAIVGAGYTGLWTAYYLAESAPDLRIVVIEARHTGFGASGRNGGWLTSAVAGHRGRMARRHGVQAVVELQRQMIASVDEVITRAALEGIHCDIDKGGHLQVARNPAQLARLQRLAEEERRWGDEGGLLTADASQELISVAGARGAYLSPHTARVHPVKLLLGLASAVRRRGVQIFERSPATEIRSGRVRTPRGEARAPVVLVATEGFTASLPGERRRLLPMNSSMLVTEPLPEAVWEELRWHGNQVLGDVAHAYMYAQRTADGRIALGGRGVPYRYGSRTDVDGRTPARTIRQLLDTLHSMFPVVRDIPVEHTWSGILGVPRDWCASITFEPGSGMGFAGGYTGHGVATANLAGRTLRDLVLSKETALTTLPHVGWQGPRWEPEPLRWIGVQALYAAYRTADRRETRRRSARTSALASVADRISGRH